MLQAYRRIAAELAGFITAIILLSGVSFMVHAETLSPDKIKAAINKAYKDYKNLKEGKNADYIPALDKVDPKVYGIALITTDGKVYTAGDLKTVVSIQSISKVFTMAKVMDESGPDAKILAVPVDKLCKSYQRVQAAEDLPPMLLSQISHFFEHYKDLEEGKWVKVEGWAGADEAKQEIMDSIKRFEQAPEKPCF